MLCSRLIISLAVSFDSKTSLYFTFNHVYVYVFIMKLYLLVI